MPVTLPKSCEVDELARWLHPMWAPGADIFREDETMARAVRALVEAKVREALYAGTCAEMDAAFDFDTTVSRVLGGAK